MILVTGATGALGSVLVPRLLAAGQPVRGLSRRRRTGENGVTWVIGDLKTGEGLDVAVVDADVIVHAATDAKPRSVDAENTGKLLEAAERAGGRPHVVYISIVGVDVHPYSYYRAKLATERLIERSGLPYTILRHHTVVSADRPGPRRAAELTGSSGALRDEGAAPRRGGSR